MIRAELPSQGSLLREPYPSRISTRSRADFIEHDELPFFHHMSRTIVYGQRIAQLGPEFASSCYPLRELVLLQPPLHSEYFAFEAHEWRAILQDHRQSLPDRSAR